MGVSGATAGVVAVVEAAEMVAGVIRNKSRAKFKSSFFRQQVSRIILRSYQKLTVVRRNGTKKKYRFEK